MSNDEESHVFTAAEAHLAMMFGSMMSVARYGLLQNKEGAQQSLRECAEHTSSLFREWGLHSLAAELDTLYAQGNLSIEEQIERLRQNMPRDPSY